MAQSDKPASQEILVALDASTLGLAALEAAAHLAEELQAELRVVFVEDENLLRLAGLPFAQEIAYASATPRPLDLREVEQSLRANAEKVRQTLIQNVYSQRVHWSFQVARGRLSRVTLAAATDARLLLIGRESRTIRQPLRAAPLRRPVVAVYDGSAQAESVLEVAATIARQSAAGLMVVVADGERGRLEELRQAAEAWIARRRIDAEILASTAPASLSSIAQQANAKLLVINQQCRLLSEAAIDALVNTLECPVGIVR